MVGIFPSSSGSYRRDPEENWFLREDVAGYEYPGEGDNYRIGVAREVMQDPRDLAPLFDILDAPFTPSITINMARTVIAKELLLHPSRRLEALLATDVESIISLEESGNDQLADCYQVVFSRHHPSRQTPKEVVLEELATVERIFTAERAKPLTPVSSSQLQQTYAFERLTATSSSQLLVGYEQLTQEVFGYGSEERELFLDEHTILIVAVKQQDGQPCVVGGAFAWQDMNYLKRSDRDVALNTYEISGAVVMDEYRGQGLYKEISVMLRTQLARLAEPVDIVFSYLNLWVPAVLAVAARASEILVTEPARQFRISLKPAMQLNMVNGRHVDDIVAYLPGRQLRSRYGGQR